MSAPKNEAKGLKGQKSPRNDLQNGVMPDGFTLKITASNYQAMYSSCWLVIQTIPKSDQIFIGVEAKHWAHIPKKLLREILGVRRELSFVNSRIGRPAITAQSLKNLRRSNPASHLVFAYSTVYPHGSGPVTEWAVPAKEFEIDLWPIPV